MRKNLIRTNSRTKTFSTKNFESFTLRDLEDIVVSLAQAPRNAKVTLLGKRMDESQTIIVSWDEDI